MSKRLAGLCLVKTPSEQAGKRDASRMTLFDRRVERPHEETTVPLMRRCAVTRTAVGKR